MGADGGVAMIDRLSLELVVAALLGGYNGLCFMGGSYDIVTHITVLPILEPKCLQTT